jgi:hypothetical protein
MSFHVGDPVECINDDGILFSVLPDGTPALPNRPKKGGVYTVRGFVDDGGVHLEEVRNPTNVRWSNAIGEGAFLPSRFRLIRKSDISIFTAMLKPSKVEA